MVMTETLLIDIQTQLRGELAERLVEEADKRGQRPIDIVADILTAVIQDDLFTAVLDD